MKQRKEEWEIILEKFQAEKAKEEAAAKRRDQNLHWFNMALNLLRDVSDANDINRSDMTVMQVEEVFKRVDTFVKWAETEGLLLERLP